MTEGLCQRGEELKMPIIATLLVIFLFVPAFAQEPDYEAYLERFGLLNECRPVVLDLILPDDAPRDLAKRTRVATESRLRSARLLSADARSPVARPRQCGGSSLQREHQLREADA